jgi:hypothetical protein
MLLAAIHNIHASSLRQFRHLTASAYLYHENPLVRSTETIT